MTYFQNIHSLADLKKEYRRLALQHHPDKGGDTAIMQRVNTEFERLFDIWKDKPDISATSTGYDMTIREPQQKNTPNMYIMNTAGKAAITRDSTHRRLWNRYVHGSRIPIRDTGSRSGARITTPSTSG